MIRCKCRKLKKITVTRIKTTVLLKVIMDHMKYAELYSKIFFYKTHFYCIKRMKLPGLL